MKRLVTVFVLFWPLVASADWDAASRAFNRGDFATAAREWRPYAEAGGSVAQYNVGLSYDKLGNMREAAKWYRMAAEQGDMDAQFNIGLMYDKGEGVPEDDREAVRWYRLAAEQGYVLAQLNIGLMYDKGEGVAEDDREAVRWYRLAAEQGNASAQSNLGLLYAKGEGVPEDYVEAYAWFNIAAAQGNESAANNREIARKLMTPAQVAQAQDRSKMILQRLARNESSERPDSRPPPLQRSGPPPALVADIQRLLDYLGYRPGPADGIAGRQTAAAIKRAQADLSVTPTGEVSEELLALLRIAVAAMATTPDQPASPTSPMQRSSGSGFFVSTEGHVVTNRHVIDGCEKVTVGGDQQVAAVLSVDEANDLALLKAPTTSPNPAPLRTTSRATLGEMVVVAGYPLSGFLANDLNVTTGSISALAGPGDNARVIQITAPVQPGNSGGPLLDKSGQVIGVVVAKLDAVKFYKATGDLPQNINFAVKGALVRGFLDIHGVNYRTGTDTSALGGVAVAERARQFVVTVGCWK